MSKYTNKDLSSIIKSDAKTIKKINNKINPPEKITLTKIMNQLSVFFGYRHFNELDNLSKNKKQLEKNNIKELENLQDFELEKIIDNYKKNIEKNILKVEYHMLFGYNFKIKILKSKTKSISNNSFLDGEELLIDQYKKNNYFKLNNDEMIDFKLYCQRENINPEKFYLFFNQEGIVLSELIDRDTPVRFCYDKKEKNTGEFFKILMLIIKKNQNKKRNFFDTFKNLNMGLQIIQGKTEKEKSEIIKGLSPEINNNNKAACIDITDKTINEENPSIQLFEKKETVIQTLGYLIRSDKLETIVFNNPDWAKEAKEIFKWVQCGYLIIVFTDDNYDHFDLLKDNNIPITEESFVFEVYNTYKPDDKRLLK